MHEDEVTDIRIYKSTNYDQFLLLEENRPVLGRVVYDSLLRKNLLIDNPILVSPQKHVFDGQYRLNFARSQGVPIYYRIAVLTTRADIGLLQNQTAWTLANHAHFRSNDEKYQLLINLSQKHGLPMGFIVNCANPGKGAYLKVKNGEFQIKHDVDLFIKRMDLLAELINYVKILLSTGGYKKHFITFKFKHALWTLLSHPNYKQKRFLDALEVHWDKVLPLLESNSEARIINGLKEQVYNNNLRNNAGTRLD